MIGRDLRAAAAALVLLAATLAVPAQAWTTDITTRPGPFRGETSTTINRHDGRGVATCITRPGPFRGQRQTSCN